jgi:hypothetical protein
LNEPINVVDEMMEKHYGLLIVSAHHFVHEWPAAGDEGDFLRDIDVYSRFSVDGRRAACHTSHV